MLKAVFNKRGNFIPAVAAAVAVAVSCGIRRWVVEELTQNVALKTKLFELAHDPVDAFFEGFVLDRRRNPLGGDMVFFEYLLKYFCKLHGDEDNDKGGLDAVYSCVFSLLLLVRSTCNCSKSFFFFFSCTADDSVDDGRIE